MSAGAVYERQKHKLIELFKIKDKLCSVVIIHHLHLSFFTIFNEGTYLTFKSIFHKAFRLF